MSVRVSWFDPQTEITHDVEVYTDESRDRIVTEKTREYGKGSVEIVGTVYTRR